MYILHCINECLVWGIWRSCCGVSSFKGEAEAERRAGRKRKNRCNKGVCRTTYGTVHNPVDFTIFENLNLPESFHRQPK